MPWNNPNSHSFSHLGIMLSAPSASGVYALYRVERLIYIGESGNIRDRLVDHLNGDNDCITRENPGLFSYELHPAPQRVLRQNLLIQELNPVCSQRLG